MNTYLIKEIMYEPLSLQNSCNSIMKHSKYQVYTSCVMGLYIEESISCCFDQYS